MPHEINSNLQPLEPKEYSNLVFILFLLRRHGRKGILKHSDLIHGQALSEEDNKRIKLYLECWEHKLDLLTQLIDVHSPYADEASTTTPDEKESDLKLLRALLSRLGTTTNLSDLWNEIARHDFREAQPATKDSLNSLSLAALVRLRYSMMLNIHNNTFFKKHRISLDERELLQKYREVRVYGALNPDYSTFLIPKFLEPNQSAALYVKGYRNAVSKANGVFSTNAVIMGTVIPSVGIYALVLGICHGNAAAIALGIVIIVIGFAATCAVLYDMSSFNKELWPKINNLEKINTTIEQRKDRSATTKHDDLQQDPNVAAKAASSSPVPTAIAIPAVPPPTSAERPLPVLATAVPVLGISQGQPFPVATVVVDAEASRFMDNPLRPCA